MQLKIMNVVGARPNFMKIAPLVKEMKKHDIDVFLAHTGQHYDNTMSKLFFDDLALPQPDIYLGVGSANHGAQTGRIMIEFESVLLQEKPDIVIVVGDVNSTIACGLVAVKQGIKLAHVEAGLRSFDRSMPEEINRLLTDQIADFLFVTEKSAEKNLLREGIDKNKIHFVGNVMIDTLLSHLEKARSSRIIGDLDLRLDNYATLTLHRPTNVDSREQFLQILNALSEIQKETPIVFPVHPRSRDRLNEFGFEDRLKNMPKLLVTEPLGYLDFLRLLAESRFVLTDSGGIQEETTVLGVPCLTLRSNTERPVTVAQGTNLVIGSSAERIVEESRKILSGNVKKGRRPHLWDGKAAERIVKILLERCVSSSNANCF
ncbi:UDP-N-acetylglucosamine 2-epimerase (non-hydrolyzing) [bacterium]|nr:UDP-N-acetylglucosamine 2-epimerase (non-hydrolyzing) [bacterium]